MKDLVVISSFIILTCIYFIIIITIITIIIIIIIIIIYSLVSEVRAPLIAGMLCKLSEWNTLGNYFLILRWLDMVFQGQYLPSLSVNYVAIGKDLEKLTHSCIR